MEAGSRRSLGLRPMANSIGVLPLKVTWVFLTVAALRINWAGVICARVVWKLYPRELGLAMEHAVQSEVSSHCAFGRMPACREDCGTPYPHNSPSDSSGMYPSIHEVLKLLLMEKYSYMDMLSNEMQHHPIQSRIQRFCLQSLMIHGQERCLQILLHEVRSRVTELRNGHVFTTC